MVVSSRPRKYPASKPRTTPIEDGTTSGSRHIPDAIKRVVFERDAGRCTFTDELGRRCPETGALEFDHVDGFARTHVHRAEDIRLLCRAHNQHAAEQMYGRAFMETLRMRSPLAAGSRSEGHLKTRVDRLTRGPSFDSVR